MGPIDFLVHLANFFAPALFLALSLPLAGRLVLRGRAPRRFWIQAAAVFAASSTVLAAGLWQFGRDGRMASYAAMVLASATVQWLAVRGWK